MSDNFPLYKNFKEVAVTPNRRDILDIVHSGIQAINTEEAIKRALVLDGSMLTLAGKTYDLEKYRSIKVVGFGKASCPASLALERLIGSRIKDSAVISNLESTCEIIKTYTGTHPMPHAQNVDATGKIIALTQDVTKDDLVFVIISGGGSSMLCWPPSEAKQGIQLYERFMHSGGTIQEINIVRKHISMVKGGGLAKLLYPATVVSLIFSDVPGGDFSVIASGPTYHDDSTVDDARAIISRYDLGEYELFETPKDDCYFERVVNVPVIANTYALDAMRLRAEELGYQTTIISSSLYEYPKELVRMFQSTASYKSVVLGGGEIRMVVEQGAQKITGKGGRNLFTSLVALESIRAGEVFMSIASDGQDNSDACSGIADCLTEEHAQSRGIEKLPFLQNFDAYSFFKETGDLVFTGPTEANVSDLFVLLSNTEQ